MKLWDGYLLMNWRIRNEVGVWCITSWSMFSLWVDNGHVIEFRLAYYVKNWFIYHFFWIYIISF